MSHLRARTIGLMPPADPGPQAPPGDRSERRFGTRSWILLGCLLVTSALATQLVDSVADGSVAATRQYSSVAEIIRQRSTPVPGIDQVSGLLSAPGGPYLRDRYGRVITLHGVNAVNKRAPYELYPSPGRSWNFSARDARQIASLGFNVVRLGILWQGIEPGSGGIDNPRTCTKGRPAAGPTFSRAVATSYLQHIRATVDLLGRFHIYTILDMHQDVYSRAFRGEGAPNWAVCTNGEQIIPTAGRWSKSYRSPTLANAERHFWLNNVIGNLQGHYDQAWAMVASYFRTTPWLVGYDPYNEPYSATLTASDDEHFAVDLECFYTGRAHPGTVDGDEAPITCPPDDPKVGVLPAILAADPHHLIFVEPDNFSIRHQLPSLLGRMPFPNLVYNFHAYCGYRSPITGDPTDLAACVEQIRNNITNREVDLARMSTKYQPGGPAWFLSEFGASQNQPLLDAATAVADDFRIGWAYWSWKYYGDPTGSSHEALVRADGTPKASVSALDHPYAEAVSGRPESTSFDPVSKTFRLQYAPNHAAGAPTIVALPPAVAFPDGYCTAVTGGTITSSPGSQHLAIVARPASTTVAVQVSAGACP